MVQRPRSRGGAAPRPKDLLFGKGGLVLKIKIVYCAV
jgi:hypothetical protein